MAIGYSLGEQYDTFVRARLASGRYHDVDDVLRAALRLMEQGEHMLADLDRAIEHGIAEANAGRVTAAGDVFDRLDARYALMADEKTND